MVRPSTASGGMPSATASVPLATMTIPGLGADSDDTFPTVYYGKVLAAVTRLRDDRVDPVVERVARARRRALLAVALHVGAVQRDAAEVLVQAAQQLGRVAHLRRRRR